MGVPRTQHGLAPSRHPAFVEMMTLKLSRPVVLSQADPLHQHRSQDCLFAFPSTLFAACLLLRASPLQRNLERTARSSTVTLGSARPSRDGPTGVPQGSHRGPT